MRTTVGSSIPASANPRARSAQASHRPQRRPSGDRIVAAVAQPGVEPEPLRFPRDIRLAHVLQRRMDRERLALHPCLGGEVGQLLEFGDEFGPAIGIARIVERIDADEQVARAARLGEAQRQAEENGVARRDVGDRNPLAHSFLGNGNVAGQRRSAESPQVQRQDDMPVGKLLRDPPRGLQLDPVPLVIIDRQRDDRIARARARFPRRPSN